MTAAAALVELLARLGARRGETVLVTKQELETWPEVAVAGLKAHKLLGKAEPAAGVVCPGCEEACTMPVQTSDYGPGRLALFVVCDKRDDINRVNVPLDALDQWQCTGELVAQALALMLGLPRSLAAAEAPGRWTIGVLKGGKLRAEAKLIADGGLLLHLAGHRVPVAEVLSFTTTGLVLDQRELRRLVDHPAHLQATETAEQRRGRLLARKAELKAEGVRGFLKVMAKEEDVSTTRLKQLMAEEPKLGGVWAGLVPTAREGSSPKRRKIQR